MKRRITAGLIAVVALAGIGAAALASNRDTSASGDASSGGHASSGHTMQPGVKVKQLALATFGERVRAGGGGIQLRTDGPKVMMTAAITVDPAGSFGWHSHPGPVQVAVERGTFSLVRVENQVCRTHRFGPGEAFVENGGRVHLGHNEGSKPVRITATFLAPAGTTEFTQSEPIPEQCRERSRPRW
jgi:quercetin dioxygenase-like cupin family protein